MENLASLERLVKKYGAESTIKFLRDSSFPKEKMEKLEDQKILLKGEPNRSLINNFSSNNSFLC